MIETALDATARAATLAPGERYLLPDGSIRTASAPLRAELVYRVNQDPSVRLPANTGPCIGLCATYGTDFLNGHPPLPEGSLGHRGASGAHLALHHGRRQTGAG